jgi:hypothetical protein
MGTLPHALLRRLADGEPGAGTLHAHRLTTVDADGWPRGATLSDGEVLALPDGSIRLATWPGSRSTANLRRTGIAVLAVVHDGAIWEIRLRAAELKAPPGSPELAYFAAEAESVDEQRAKYAEVLHGTAFRLNDPQATHDRWRAQRDAMRSAT